MSWRQHPRTYLSPADILSVYIPAQGHARSVEQIARTTRSDSVFMSMGLERNDVKELASALWEIVGGYRNDRTDERND